MHDTENENLPSHVTDARELTATALQQKYKLTYSTWRNRKYAAKRKGAPWAAEFEDFASFLELMGPRPSKGHTLDRIDNRNPAYGPAECRWLDSRGQANNRSSTTFVRLRGEPVPISDAARELGVSRGVLKRHLEKNIEQVEEELEGLFGVINFGRNPHQYQPWPWNCPGLGNRNELERLFLLAGGMRHRSRYRFLIDHLADLIRPMEQWLGDNIADQETDEFNEINGQVKLLDELYHKKRAEMELWVEACREYDTIADAKDYERIRARRSRYDEDDM